MGPVAPGVDGRLRGLALWYQIRDVDGTLARAPPLLRGSPEGVIPAFAEAGPLAEPGQAGSITWP